jgi:hypothetical protein
MADTGTPHIECPQVGADNSLLYRQLYVINGVIAFC